MKKPANLLVFCALALLVGHRIISNADASNKVQVTTIPSPLMVQHDPQSGNLFQGIKQEPTYSEKQPATAEHILGFANKLMGTSYCIGGNSPSGFDCSGFTNYVYSHFGLNVPHGSVNQALVGKQIPEGEARKGDLLIFTGTNLSIREPGHVGIVISDKGEPIRFIHSSSNGGVKISEVPNTRYAQRLLQVRRVI